MVLLLTGFSLLFITSLFNIWVAALCQLHTWHQPWSKVKKCQSKICSFDQCLILRPTIPRTSEGSVSLNLYGRLRVIELRAEKAPAYTGRGRQDGHGLSTDSDTKEDSSDKEGLREAQLYQSEEDDWEQSPCSHIPVMATHSMPEAQWKEPVWNRTSASPIGTKHGKGLGPAALF